jgi:uncharacterized protein YrrD
MLLAISTLKGFSVEAKDGALGTVSDFLFDDTTWKLRWLVIDTGKWLTGRKVLVHPSVIGDADHGSCTIMVGLTKAQVEDSPAIGQDQPVSRQMQNDLYSYYGWDPYWGGGIYGAGMYGAGVYGGALSGGGVGGLAPPLSTRSSSGEGGAGGANYGEGDRNEGDPHLRSTAEVTGYHVHATDGDIGHVEDFLVDSASWGIRYLIVDTSNWWFGQHVLMSPYAVKEVDWSDHHIRLDLSRDKVKSSPSWNPADEIDGEFESRLHSHYNWPGYGGSGAEIAQNLPSEETQNAI